MWQITRIHDFLSQLLDIGKVKSVTVSSTPLLVKDYSSFLAIIDTKKGTGHFEVSTDGTNFVPIQVQRIGGTNKKSYRVWYKGAYQINIQGFTHLKWVVDFVQGATPTSVNGTLSPKYNNLSELKATNKEYAPYPARLKVTLGNQQFLQPYDYDSEGKLYLASGGALVVSSDLGQTTTTLVSSGLWGTNKIEMIRVVNNTLVVFVYNSTTGKNEIYKSDIAKTSYTKVYEFDRSQGEPRIGFGVDSYNDFVFVAPYKQQTRLASEVLQIHASYDGGSTFNVIHTAPSIERWHYHDVVFDPYRNMLWMASGDSSVAALWYCLNYQSANPVWTQVEDAGLDVVQYTCVFPMPKCILLGTDSPGLQGIARLVPHTDSWSGKTEIELVYNHERPGGDGNPIMRAYTSYDKAGGIAYLYTDKLRKRVIATKDGENFYQIHEHREHPLRGVHPVGEKLVLQLQGANTRLYIADKLKWEEI